MKGQSSLEYLIIIAALLFLLGTFTVSHMFNPGQDTTQKVTSSSLASSACDSIANKINGVSTSGEGAVDSVRVNLIDDWALEIE